MRKRRASQRTPSKLSPVSLEQSPSSSQITTNRLSSAVRRLNGTTPSKHLSESKSKGCNTARKSLYERSKLHLAAKEQKVKQLESTLNRELTFKPVTNGCRTKSHDEDTVFDRLYQLSKKKRSVPITPSTRGRTSSKVSSRSTPSSTTSSRSGSSSATAFNRLYKEGLRRARTKSLTDRVERQRRIYRQQERELEACTFRPRMDWKKDKKDEDFNEALELPPPPPQLGTGPRKQDMQMDIVSRQVSVCQSTNDVDEGGSQATPEPLPTTVSCDDTLLTKATVYEKPPIQVIHARVVTSTPRQSPFCRYAVSPLRDPDYHTRYEDVESIAFDGATEYGSI
eukprot:CAMPEP_0194036512 /NCGR_PEP_ID=MMETSP0009_2-20130614/8872_1 /TAXON_ID=210454 /ORGANISM="Grammatophora oceanica, Strain CCMP 410" /LENGTH=338 /DNA_ID=CAMNT_0038678303 /DNA_START=65 /DNA_END=1081 /DNA_ORIENTATION=-